MVNPVPQERPEAAEDPAGDVDLAETSRADRPLVGYVGLQDHGLPLWFRKVRIKKLD